MKITFLSALDEFPYFTTEAVKQLLGDESLVKGTIQTALYRWMKTGKIIALKKGMYMTQHFYELHRTDPGFASMVSAILIPWSYVSLEYILQSHGILTDVTFPVTAVTIKQTRVINNFLGIYTYRNIKENLYTGFVTTDYKGIPISQATVAKALFDMLYLRSWKNIGRGSKNSIAENLRLNLEDFSESDKNEFANYIELSKSRKMDQIWNNLRNTVWRY
jgi:predicted transcriptional regulator of viral defense system